MRSIISRKNRFNRKGMRVGYWEEYFSNGNLSWRGSYMNGKKDGIWEYYNKDGQLYGIWEYYNKDGQLFSKVLYEEDIWIKQL